MKAPRLESPLKDVAAVPDGDLDCAPWAEEACEGFVTFSLLQCAANGVIICAILKNDQKLFIGWNRSSDCRSGERNQPPDPKAYNLRVRNSNPCRP